MARALLIGCGCHGRRAGELLIARGWSVRGTSRRPEALGSIERAGIEPALADPDRVGTLSALVADVTVLAWLLGDARGSADELEALYGERLPSLLAALVDTPVRGLVFEGVGDVGEELLDAGRERFEELSGRCRIPLRVVEVGREAGGDDWAPAVADAVEGVVGSGG